MPMSRAHPSRSDPATRPMLRAQKPAELSPIWTDFVLGFATILMGIPPKQSAKNP
jgi:hypothetical protein